MIKIDKLFKMHQFNRDQMHENWTEWWITKLVILEPHFKIRDITSIYQGNIV